MSDEDRIIFVERVKTFDFLRFPILLLSFSQSNVDLVSSLGAGANTAKRQAMRIRGHSVGIETGDRVAKNGVIKSEQANEAQLRKR